MEEIKPGQLMIAKARAKDKSGNPTALPGPVAWSTTDHEVIFITINSDGTCTVKGGAMGQAKLHAKSGDAIGEINLVVVADEAAYLEISLDPFPETGGRAR